MAWHSCWRAWRVIPLWPLLAQVASTTATMTEIHPVAALVIKGVDHSSSLDQLSSPVFHAFESTEHCIYTLYICTHSIAGWLNAHPSATSCNQKRIHGAGPALSPCTFPKWNASGLNQTVQWYSRTMSCIMRPCNVFHCRLPNPDRVSEVPRQGENDQCSTGG